MQFLAQRKSVPHDLLNIFAAPRKAVSVCRLSSLRHSAEEVIRKLRLTVVLVLMWMLSACTSVATPGATDESASEPAAPEFLDLFGSRPAIPTPEQILHLTSEQEQKFLEYFNRPQNQTVLPYLRVANYLFENTTNLQYDGVTLTAAQSLELNKGNCLSLALLTTALAKLVNVGISYQLVDSSPVFGMSEDLVKKEIHIKSVVYQLPAPGNSKTALRSLDRVVIDYFPSRQGRFISNLSANEFLAMYYLNIAGVALETQDYANAYWHLREALDYNPYDAAAWNTMGVVYRRIGEPAKAEEIYKFAIAHAENKLTLLKNYHLLLSSQGRIAEAAAIEEALHEINDPSPFHWYSLARESYEMKAYADALRYFDKALEMAPYLHEAHLGKAQSFYQLGYITEAELALKMAILNVDKESTRSVYEAKLMALEGAK